jgi:integrase
MATIKFLLQSKSENSNIYIRLSISRNQIFYRKTGFIVNAKDWIIDKQISRLKDDYSKKINIRIGELKTHLERSFNNSVSEGLDITGDWLQNQIDTFNNKKTVIDLDVLTNYIQKFINDAPYKQNAKKGTGLSEGRVRNLKLFKNTITRYEKEALSSKAILIKNINLSFVEAFKSWLFSQSYSINYVGKNINNIKTICIDASKNDIETSTQLKNIKSISEQKAPDKIVYLSEEEQETIKNAPLINEAHINARKWLLLGCLIGQRAGDMLSITENNIKDLNGVKIIELKQQKTGKLVAIPILPEAQDIIKDGLPYKISLPRFNEYIKDVCEIAEINEVITGRIKTQSRSATTIETKAKYKFITSHVCRRSFASNYYGRIPTPVLMNITAHGTEKMFLTYIGKTTYDNAYQMLDYFSKLAPKKVTQPVMKVLKNGS